jgi:hypothetical protein
MNTIYTFGDSHCCFPWGVFNEETNQFEIKTPNVVVPFDHVIGIPQTMYKFGLSRKIIVDNIPEEDIACFCWGEIDCRCHIHNHQPWKETIENVVKEYLTTIRMNSKIHSKIWIFNVVPPLLERDRIDRWYGSKNQKVPFIGTDDERLSYAKYMNQLLKESEFTFIDIWNKYCNKDEFLIRELSDGSVHIADNRYLVEWINQYKLGNIGEKS